jgi:crotonobetainyl-CoA:carnitine CoA-transferase CaiB-like acyl-CoA transferase
VVVQNFSPRVMANLGIDYEALKAIRPEIVLVSMPAFGLSGPFRDRIAYGPGVDAMSGLSHLTGYSDGPPMKPGNFFCDQNAGLLASFATLAALRHREASGEGQHIELAMIEGEFQVLGDAYIDYAFNGRQRMRQGNEHAWMAPHDVYPCAGEDAWVAIAVENDEQFAALCTVIGRPELMDDARFKTVAARHENRAQLKEPVSLWARERTHIQAQDALQSAGVPAGAALDSLELLSNPHVMARHGFEYVDTPGVGLTPYPRVAFTLSGTPVRIERPAPGFGEANVYVLGELLGLSANEIDALEEREVVTRIPTGGH